MKNIFKISKRGIIAILTLCILLGNAGTCINVAAMAAETTASVEETAVATDKTTQELMPMMARMCYDYNTVDDCMRDISSTYGFDYSLSGNSYTCNGNSHNYIKL